MVTQAGVFNFHNALKEYISIFLSFHLLPPGLFFRSSYFVTC